MQAADFLTTCKVAIELFSNDPAALVRHLQGNLAVIDWAANKLEPVHATIAVNLLRLLKEWEQHPEKRLEIAADLRTYCQGVVPRGMAVPPAIQFSQLIAILSLLITATSLLIGPDIVHRFIEPWLGKGLAKDFSTWSIPVSSMRYIHALQLIVILIIIYFEWKRLTERVRAQTNAGPIAKKTLQQFRRDWLLMWGMWLLLYAWFAYSAWFLDPKSKVVLTISDILDVISGIAIWRCFFVMDLPSVNLSEEPDRNKPYLHAQLIAITIGFICIGLTVLDRLRGLNYFGAASVGLYSGIGLAALTGRLGSHHIRMPRWMLFSLYLYSMIQVFYSFFVPLGSGWQAVVYLMALALKVVLAFAGINMLKYGGFDAYLDAAENGFLRPPKLFAKAKAAAVMLRN